MVAAVHAANGSVKLLGEPLAVNFLEAEQQIEVWQRETTPDMTLILLDQPTIVKNSGGQRPVEKLVSSPVSKRYGGVQPANIGRKGMFCGNAPIWPFLEKFRTCGLVTTPLEMGVLETYPVLAIIAFGWLQDDARPTGRLPKYNPGRKSMNNLDWNFLCGKIADKLSLSGLNKLAEWVQSERNNPKKADQDGVDACICLLVAVHLISQKDCLAVGNLDGGQIIVPNSDLLKAELESRCAKLGLNPSEWVRSFRVAHNNSLS
jgi:predicted RNase H-like nuclease